ncbi:SPOSA6832_00005 [Sporobolomyces salmonicolor]|uniref:D-aminoacyl-tRNA deacylase n=1 Tax=Sporidiobolus salmonicolor TaxID=5005 RepID=A0A0D6EF95_SPOSA|nr:SPOSA6832_00005 [Sporobolomyces salmonicolor]
MRAIVQRCRSAHVAVDGQVISSIGRGLLCLIGISKDDTEYEAHWLASKLLSLRLFPEDKDGESWGWKKSVVDADYEVLCVSQFTLYAALKKGSKPDFHAAMVCSPLFRCLDNTPTYFFFAEKSSETSKKMYEDFLQDLRHKYRADQIQDGQFGAMMDVQLINDVRILALDTLPAHLTHSVTSLFASQGPVTLILDSATDAPARPVPKAALSANLKQKRKEELAARLKAKEQRIAAGKASASAAATPDLALASTLESAVEQKDEDELIQDAEEKSRQLAERFKVAMTESY